MTIHDNEVLFYTGKDVQMEFELTNRKHSIKYDCQFD